MPDRIDTVFLRRLALILIYITAIFAYPGLAQAKKGHGAHDAIHLHLHGEHLPELANVLDFVRAGMAEVLVPEAEGELAPGKEHGTLILTGGESVNFLEAGVGRDGQYPVERSAENKLYTLWVKSGDGEEKRYIISVIEARKLTVVQPHGAGGEEKEAAAAGHEEKHEEAKSVTYRVKEEHTLTSNVIGGGLMGLNFSDITNIAFSALCIFSLILISFFATKNLKRIPKGLQTAVEMLVGGLKTFVDGILGEHTVVYLPFVGTLFVYILCMAFIGLVPFAKSPIAMNYNVPLSMALCVFLFVQYHAVRQNGAGGYIKHLMGEPIWLAPLQMPLHILGEFIKPLSLSMRLFANISAEDILIAALVLMVVGLPVYAPVPLQLLFFPLALMFSLIQAIVFMSLSSVYIALMFPHHEGHEEGHH